MDRGIEEIRHNDGNRTTEVPQNAGRKRGTEKTCLKAGVARDH